MVEEDILMKGMDKMPGGILDTDALKRVAYHPRDVAGGGGAVSGQQAQENGSMQTERIQRRTHRETRREILVTQSTMPPMEEFVGEIRDIWRTRWLTNMGQKHRALEQQLRDYLGVPHISLMVNGHMALEMALQGLGLRGEVITTPFTFASTTHAIVRNGLVPVFCDIDPQDFTMDARKIEALVTPRTSAIVPVHVYGNVCRVGEIERIAKKYGLKVVYDAAHTFGERLHGRGVASFGDASILSFHATKVFHAIEGGAVCFRDSALEGRLYNLKNFGIRDEECVEAVGANAKMNEFQAAMGLCNLRHIGEAIAARRRVAEAYQEGLAGLPGVDAWKRQEGLEANYAYFPVVFHPEQFGATRDDVYAALGARGIHARKYFYPATNEFACYRGRIDAGDTPVAARISRRVLCLPIYPGLPLDAVDEICDAIRRIGRK